MNRNYLYIAIALCGINAQAQKVIPNDTSIVETELNETSVVAKKVHHNSDRDTYLITTSDVSQFKNPLQLIGHLPGMHYDMRNENVSINNSTSLAWQVNGIDKSKEQVLTIPTAAIQRVEIIHTPEGRYASQGIKYVVNICMKENYKGLDVDLSNFLIVSPNGHNGDNAVATEQPRLALQFLKGKWNVNAGYSFGDFHWNYPLEYEKWLSDGSRIYSSASSPHHPNEQNKNRAHAGRFGVDFTPNDKHSLSFNASLTHDAKQQTTDYTLIKSKNESAVRLAEHNYSTDYANDLRTSLAYRGNLSAQWELNASVNYNRVWSNRTFFYQWGNGLPQQFQYAQTKDYALQQMAATYTAPRHWKLDFGISNTFNRYGTNNRLEKAPHTDWQNSYRGNVYAYVSKTWKDCVTMRLGLGASYVRFEGMSKAMIEPNLSLNYHPQSKFALQIDYKIRPQYPRQYQLTPMMHAIDSVLIQQGNPSLRPLTQNHELNVTATLWDNLTLTSFVSYNANDIQEYYQPLQDRQSIGSSFANAKLFQSLSAISYTLPFSQFLMWSNTVRANYYKVKSRNMSRHEFSWGLTSELTYFNPKWQAAFQLSYNRGLVRAPRLQGYFETGQDFWQIAVQKSAFNNRLGIQFIYLPPLHLGVHKYQKQQIDTPFYKNCSRLGLRTYDNMLFLRLSWQLHKGKETKSVIDRTTYDDESVRSRDLL